MTIYGRDFGFLAVMIGFFGKGQVIGSKSKRPAGYGRPFSNWRPQGDQNPVAGAEGMEQGKKTVCGLRLEFSAQFFPPG